jgi:hypothetical protein
LPLLLVATLAAAIIQRSKAFTPLKEENEAQ